MFDLTAGEALGVDAALHALDDVVGRVLAAEQRRVRHARQRHRAERLAATVAGRLDPVVLRAQPVVHVADEHAVLDQHVVLTGVAFVVDVDRAARVQ